MIIIIHDDPAYVSWLGRHHQGYVVDSPRKPTKHHLILHRATCSIIKPHKRARLTTGAHIKACSLDAGELAAWAVEVTGAEVVACAECEPYRDDAASGEHATRSPTRLESEALSYVLDLAVMYLDGEDRRYHPKVEDVATYLAKSAAQLMPAVRRLIAEGYLECEPPAADGAPTAASILYPTADALRTIPAFAEMDERTVDAELQTLKTPPEGP